MPGRLPSQSTFSILSNPALNGNVRAYLNQADLFKPPQPPPPLCRLRVHRNLQFSNHVRRNTR